MAQKNNQQNNQQKEKRNDHRGRHGQHHKDGAKQADRAPQKNDLSKDSKEDRELAEWRAKIVLNAATPTAPATLVAEEAPVQEEPLPQLSNEELFASPVGGCVFVW